MKAANPLDIGKAYKAWLAYNHKAKQNRVESFDLNRWLNVIHALNGKARDGWKTTPLYKAPSEVKRSMPSKKWTKERRERYKQTILNRKLA